MSKRSILGSTLFFCALSIMAGSAWASPIVYSVTDTGSGTLGSTPFTNQTVTVSFVSDTTNLTGSAGFFTSSIGTGYLVLGNAAPVLFTDPSLFFFDNQTADTAGIAASQGSILDTENSTFATYTGSTTFPATSGAVFFRPDLSFTTAAGAFNLATAGATSTFSASVPEPTSLTFLGLTAVGLLGARRRER